MPVLGPTCSILPTSSSFYTNQSQLFTSSVEGGTGPYTYQWYVAVYPANPLSNGTPMYGATDDTYLFSSVIPNIFNVALIVTDDDDYTGNSNVVTVTISEVPVSPTELSVQMITRVKDAYIGVSGSEGEYTIWTGIKSIKYTDVDPWININIPYGKMIHQEVRSPHIEGQILCYDFSSLQSALYNTVIDGYGHYAIDATNVLTVGTIKWRVNYFIIHYTDQLGNIITAIFEHFRIRTVELEDIEAGKEARIIVKFCADEVSYI